MRVFVTGATGLVGRAIVRALVDRGDDVVAQSRVAARARDALGAGVTVIEADPTEAGDWQQSLCGCAAVINLCGEPIAGRRWDAQIRQILIDSRVDATETIVRGIAACGDRERPRVLVNASGVDYYDFEAFSDEDVFDEESPAGDTFLAKLCSRWEAEASRAAEHGVRVVAVRTGVALSRDGGALPRLASVFRAFAGGPIGSGKQWFSWIHLDDLVGAYLHAVDNSSVSGPVNAVAPGAVRQREFAAALGRALHRPSLLRTPAFAIKLVAGELGEYLVRGRHAVPRALETSGYHFRYPELADALAALYS